MIPNQHFLRPRPQSQVIHVRQYTLLSKNSLTGTPWLVLFWLFFNVQYFLVNFSVEICTVLSLRKSRRLPLRSHAPQQPILFTTTWTVNLMNRWEFGSYFKPSLRLLWIVSSINSDRTNLDLGNVSRGSLHGRTLSTQTPSEGKPLGRMWTPWLKYSDWIHNQGNISNFSFSFITHLC